MTVSQVLLIHKIVPRILLYLVEPSGELSKCRRKGVLRDSSAELYNNAKALSRMVRFLLFLYFVLVCM